MARTTINDLPNEVIYQILFNLSPLDATSVVISSRRLHAFLGQPLWRHFCQVKYKYWQDSWNVESIYGASLDLVDWKYIYLYRQHAEHRTETSLEQILGAQSHRLCHYRTILSYEFDIKDVLLRQMEITDKAQDVLARRYYSSLLLNTLHRKAALKIWASVANGENVSLEKAMVAFEMFLWKERPEGFEDISARLDAMSAELCAAQPNILDQTARQKALSLARYMRSQGFREPHDSTSYSNLRNHFIGAALQGDNHPCVPLVLVTIYSCIASRIGLDVKLCCVPYHVYAQVRPAMDTDLDGQPYGYGTDVDLMYMDPYRTDQEVGFSDLTSSLRTMNAPQSAFETVTKASTIPEILLRAARNIVFSVDILRRRPDRDELLVNQQRNPRDVDGAFYGALATLLLLGRMVEGTDLAVPLIGGTQCIQYLYDLLHVHYPIEMLNFEEFASPFFNGATKGVERGCHRLKIDDSKSKQPKPRTKEVSEKVRYKVGQVFRHKRYAYQAVIIGWDPECAAGEPWIRQMGVHQLPGGRTQSFYNVM